MKASLAQKAIMVSVIVVIILCVFILWTLSQETSSLEKHVICSSLSKDGMHQVAIVTYGQPLFFGAQSIGIELGEYGDVIYTKVGNDGATIDKNNFEISWEDNIAIVVVSGKNQTPVTYRILFGMQGAYHIERD